MVKRRELIKGDKLREMIFLVYLNNKYGLGKRIEVRKLKDFLGYSTGGLYNALDESGYFVRNVDEITLSEKGKRYVRSELMQYYRAFNPIGHFLIFLGLVLILQWYLLTYHRILMVFDWYVGISIIAGGLLIRFALLPMIYWFLKVRRKL